MSGWCTEAQLSLACNTSEITSWADDAGDGTADTGVKAWAIDHAAYWIWSIISVQYGSTTAMNPTTYTAGGGVYPVLERMNAALAVDVLRARQGRKTVGNDHPAIQWSRMVAAGLAVIA